MSVKKKLYITEEEREKCRKVIDTFAELYEIEDEDILVVDVGRYGFIKLQCYTPSYGFEMLDTYTDSNSLFEGLWDEWERLRRKQQPQAQRQNKPKHHEQER